MTSNVNVNAVFDSKEELNQSVIVTNIINGKKISSSENNEDSVPQSLLLQQNGKGMERRHFNLPMVCNCKTILQRQPGRQMDSKWIFFSSFLSR